MFNPYRSILKRLFRDCRYLSTVLSCMRSFQLYTVQLITEGRIIIEGMKAEKVPAVSVRILTQICFVCIQHALS